MNWFIFRLKSPQHLLRVINSNVRRSVTILIEIGNAKDSLISVIYEKIYERNIPSEKIQNFNDI